MSSSLADLARGCRGELAALGPAAAPLLAALDAVARLGAGRDLAALDDPVFALDLLAALDPTAGAVAGRLLAYLRSRDPSGPTAGHAVVTVAAAVAAYESGAFLLLARNTQRTYRTWLRRLADEYGETDVRELTTGDLADLIAKHAPQQERSAARRAPRRSPVTAVSAFRKLWAYLEDKHYADAIAATGRDTARSVHNATYYGRVAQGPAEGRRWLADRPIEAGGGGLLHGPTRTRHHTACTR